MTMLQIPRDTLVGEIGGSAGKINGIFANSADNENRVNHYSVHHKKVFGLPIDDYVTIDYGLPARHRGRVSAASGWCALVTIEYDGNRLKQGWRGFDGRGVRIFPAPAQGTPRPRRAAISTAWPASGISTRRCSAAFRTATVGRYHQADARGAEIHQHQPQFYGARSAGHERAEHPQRKYHHRPPARGPRRASTTART